MVNVKAVLERLGAKRTSERWSWDAVQPDGSIIFIGWDDDVKRTTEQAVESCRIFEHNNPVNEKPGGRERARHIREILDSNSVGYLLIATAKDVHARPRRIARVEENLYSVRLEKWGNDIFAVSVGLNSAPERDFEIINDVQIPETEAQELNWARRGQGLFRRRVELIEHACRITGISDHAHLRASHIKPWRNSTNVERLDGHNGLLLAPHVDHLFDRGFISFEDDGTMLVSPRLSPSLLRAWGIPSAKSCGTFKVDQSKYLAYHREHQFLGS